MANILYVEAENYHCRISEAAIDPTRGVPLGWVITIRRGPGVRMIEHFTPGTNSWMWLPLTWELT